MPWQHLKGQPFLSPFILPIWQSLLPKSPFCWQLLSVCERPPSSPRSSLSRPSRLKHQRCRVSGELAEGLLVGVLPPGAQGPIASRHSGGRGPLHRAWLYPGPCARGSSSGLVHPAGSPGDRANTTLACSWEEPQPTAA